MTDEQLTAQPAPAEATQPDQYRAAILAKVDVAWGSNVGDQGHATPSEVAARAFDALYQPGELETNMDARAQVAHPDASERESYQPPSQRLRPETRDALLAPLELVGSVPSPDEFVLTVANAILHGVDVASTILPGAREQIQQLVDVGDRPAMWSAGHPEHQYRKFGATGLRDIVAMESIEPPVEVTSEHGEPIDIETAVAPHKTTAETFERVREIAGGDQVVVVDDRVRNLTAFRAGMPETKAAIWVQFGAHAEKEMQKLASGDNPQLAEAIANGTIIPIASIDQLTAKIAQLRTDGILTAEQAAVFLDYDDTIGDNSRRRDLELEAAVDAIFEHGWA